MKKLFIMAIACCMMACNSQRTEKNEAEAAPQEEVKVSFIEENFPQKNVDVNTFSKGIQHIGLPTADVQRTIDFYTTLGFKLATRHDINGRDFAFLQLGDLLIEVIPTQDPAMLNGAVDHFCLDVKNIDELYTQLKEAGYNVIDPAVNDIAFWQKGARYFFIQGPNAEKIEFCEIL